MIPVWWKDLSVSKKLYAVVGVMALLIATELFTLLFAMDILSAVRTFVGGEGLWSKAQKNAIHSFQRYALTQDPQYWNEYEQYLQVNAGDHDARLALESQPPNIRAATDGFLRGGMDRDDIPGLIKLIRRFYWVSYISRALQIWREADIGLSQFRGAAEKMHDNFRHGRPTPQELDLAMREIERSNAGLTDKEIEFSNVLGEGSRWLESILMALLIMAVLTVESTGLFLTVSLSRSLNRSLKELMHGAEEVGHGNFGYRLPVRSRDELGLLAVAINKMSDDLARSIGARRQAESASESKTMFLANMSHEIRTPLGVILGLAEMLKEPDLTKPEQLSYVETIERTGKNLNRIINDILDVSRVESGHLDIETSRFALTEFNAELQAMFSVTAQKSENRFVLKAPPQSLFVVTDRTRLRQILINLVNNAFKFTVSGQVTLSIETKGDLLIFDVTDSGAGISEENKLRLFKPFSRGENLLGTTHEGSGLGLVLSKRLAQALGGDVVLLHSEVGQGSTFRATVRSLEPVEQTVPAPITSTEKPAEGQLSGRRILVVEDSEDNQMLVRLFLSRQGAVSDFANNGQEGVAKAMHDNYDAVLMDMQMPVMDGYRATESLRSQGFKKPIIALTAHAMKEDRDRCLAAGCDDYLTKPIDSKLLYGALVRHMDA